MTTRSRGRGFPTHLHRDMEDYLLVFFEGRCNTGQARQGRDSSTGRHSNDVGWELGFMTAEYNRRKRSSNHFLQSGSTEFARRATSIQPTIKSRSTKSKNRLEEDRRPDALEGFPFNSPRRTDLLPTNLQEGQSAGLRCRAWSSCAGYKSLAASWGGGRQRNNLANARDAVATSRATDLQRRCQYTPTHCCLTSLERITWSPHRDSNLLSRSQWGGPQYFEEPHAQTTFTSHRHPRKSQIEKSIKRRQFVF